MLTVKAIIDKDGIVRLLDPVMVSGPRHALVTILEDNEPVKLRPHGLCAGDFIVPDDFDDPLPPRSIRPDVTLPGNSTRSILGDSG